MKPIGIGKTRATSRIQTDDLVSALHSQLERHFGRRRQITEFSRRVSEYSTSFELEELDVVFEDGERLELILKSLSWRSLFPEAREVRPRFLYDPEREIRVYEAPLAAGNLGTAVCYGAVIDRDDDRYWLFIERVSSPKLCHVGEFAAWEQTAAWLGRMHALYDTDRAWNQMNCLLRYDQHFFRRWLERAKTFLAGDKLGRCSAAKGHWLMRQYEFATARLIATPATFLHGEFYASNILIGGSGESRRICPVDWELAAAGPGLIDLAALIAGQWPEARKGEMVTAYHQSLIEHGAAPPSLPELWFLLDCCRLHIAMQWLTWSAQWNAPAEHQHDWLQEAISIAKKVEH